MIDLRSVSYEYPDSTEPALAGLDLNVAAGETFLLAGRSGSGKSTALRAVAGLVPRFYGGRFAGTVCVAGMDTRGQLPMELAAKVGMVFQEPEARFLSRRAEDEIAFGLEIAGFPAEEIRRRVNSIVERLELGPLLARPLETLSAGEQQRVAVAAAVGRQPEVLLLDEPTSQLDGRSAGEVVDWVSGLCRASGLTVLIAESRLGRWSQTAHRLGHLDAGRLSALGPMEEAVAKLPIAPPLAQAARALGLTRWLGDESEAALRAKLEAVTHGRIELPAPGLCRLRASGVRFAFDGTPVLAGVDLDVGEGETVALVGRNGSGKTTLLRCLIGLLAPQAGEVELDGTSILGQPVPERARRIGYVPQWPAGLLFAPDLRQELQITLGNLGRLAGGGRDPDELLARFGLLQVADRYPRDLSAGQRQRAALAAILVARPDVLLLDEPTLGMDPMAQEDLGRLLADLRREGAAVLVATHDVEFAARHAQRCTVLEEGHVVTAGPTAESLFSRPATRTALQRLTGRARPATAWDLEDRR